MGVNPDPDGPYAAAARLVKAARLADVLDEARADPERITAEQWGLAQTIAQVHPASEATRREVRRLLYERQAARAAFGRVTW